MILKTPRRISQLPRIKRRKANSIGHNCFLKHVIEGKIEGKKRRGTALCSYWMALRNEKSLYFEAEYTMLHCVENWLLKKIQTCIKTYYAMNVYEPFKSQWSLYVPLGLTFTNYTFCPHSCIYVFCADLRTNSHSFPIQH